MRQNIRRIIFCEPQRLTKSQAITRREISLMDQQLNIFKSVLVWLYGPRVSIAIGPDGGEFLADMIDHTIKYPCDQVSSVSSACLLAFLAR